MPSVLLGGEKGGKGEILFAGDLKGGKTGVHPFLVGKKSACRTPF